jgi:hypothetical protein
MGEPDFSQYGLTKEQEEVQKLLRILCIENDAEERAEDIAAGKIPRDTPKYPGDALFGKPQKPTGSRMDPPPQGFDASTVPTNFDARSGYKRPRPNTGSFNVVDPEHWHRVSSARRAFFQNPPSNRHETSAAVQSHARQDASQSSLGAPIGWRTGFDQLPDHDLPKVKFETPTSYKAPATLFSQFEVPVLPEHDTDQDSRCSLSGLYGAVKTSLASWTQDTFAG